MRRFVLLGLSGLLPTLALAAAPNVTALRPNPTEVPVRDSTKVVFTARITADPGHTPSKVRLMRLQWAGNSREAAQMVDDGTHGDQVKNDGIYTATVKLKEPIIGLISYSVEAVFPDSPDPVRSQPLFIKVIGGLK